MYEKQPAQSRLVSQIVEHPEAFENSLWKGGEGVASKGPFNVEGTRHADKGQQSSAESDMLVHRTTTQTMMKRVQSSPRRPVKPTHEPHFEPTSAACSGAGATEVLQPVEMGI